MNKKYTIEEKKVIVNEAINSKDKTIVAIKYNLHYTTIYSWIRKFKTQKGRDYKVTFKLSKEEYIKFLEKCKSLGYEKDVSSYIRKLLFSKHIATGNPIDIVKELYTARGELNKVGSNLNQIANYTNFLMSQSYVENGYAIELRKILKPFLLAVYEQRNLIDKTIKKI